MSYRLRHYPYSGGYIDLIDEDELDVCRKRAASRIYSHRNVMEYPVAVLEKGRKWEMETGDDACMIGDGEGILCIEEIETDEDDCQDGDEDDGFGLTECRQCGVDFDNRSLGVDELCDDCVDLNRDEDDDEPDA